MFKTKDDLKVHLEIQCNIMLLVEIPLCKFAVKVRINDDDTIVEFLFTFKPQCLMSWKNLELQKIQLSEQSLNIHNFGCG